MSAYTPATVTVTNIISGCSEIWIDDTVDIHLGSTTEPIKIENKREYEDVVVEQVIGSIGKILTNETCVINGVLAEATLANLKYLIGDGTDAGFGSNEADTGRAFAIKTKGAGATTRTFSIKKGVISTGTTVEMGKGKIHNLPFTIECFKDASASDGAQFWTVADA